MSGMQGLTIIVAGTEPARFHAALSVAAANAALGGRSRIFLQGEATRLLGSAALAWAQQDNPSLAELVEEASALGAEISACQSGLALVGLSVEQLPQGVTTTGLVELLASRGSDQLMMA